jgi:hypothetical protein
MRVTRHRLQLGVVLALFAVSLAGAQQAQEPPSAGLEVLADQLKDLFPTIEGEVIDVQGTTLTVSIGRKDGLQPRVDLVVYREGRELRHPKTGEVLGRAEQSVGRAVVTQVAESYATATLRENAEVKQGDRVRLSSGKVKVTLLPLPAAGVKPETVELALQDVLKGLGRTGRFQLLMGDQISVWLGQQGIKPEEFLEGKGLEEAARRFKVDYLLALSVRNVEKRPYLEARLLAPPDREPLLTTGLFVPAAKPKDRQGQFSAGPDRPAQRSRERSFLARLLFGELEAGAYSSGEASIPLKEIGRFGFAVRSMDVAVAPKDHIPRLVLTDGDKIYVNRITEGTMTPEWTYGGRGGGAILSVQFADVDGDGVFEVVVNRHSPQSGMISSVIGLVNGKPAMLADNIPYILLAVDEAGDGVRKSLWGQRYSEQTFFTPGQADRFVVKDGKLVSVGTVRVPHEFRAIGATYSNIVGKGSRALAFIDGDQHLRIATGDEEQWRSSSRVGKTFVSVELPRIERAVTYTKALYTEPYPVSIDLDGDGVEEIIVPQNQSEGFLAVIYKGPAGYRLQSVNSGFEGMISALGAIPPDGERTTPSLVAAVVRFSGFVSGIRKSSSGETQIIMTIPD